jgi:hypothetical protein
VKKLTDFQIVILAILAISLLLYGSWKGLQVGSVLGEMGTDSPSNP